ncbi:hypothetical protein NUW58_g10023 [Xylaria curta]|uniref:Uncharacterized protein n=1 Tax=Xylaria curta TaxID=42375 RepID=A0ACC1MQK5_9PEZI|nr:hypothetical protein NUW58_g10023 [Xylaria curta]
MGIKSLFSVIKDEAPAAIKEGDIKNQFGRKVAIDASMSIYSFLIAVRSDGQQLTNESGDTTSHLMGMFYRTLRMVDNGIKPLYVSVDVRLRTAGNAGGGVGHGVLGEEGGTVWTLDDEHGGFFPS